MKKLFCVFLALLATVCLLSMTVSAEATVSLSDDLQTLTFDGRTYSRADLSLMGLYYEDRIYDVPVPAHLEPELKEAILHYTYNHWVASLDLYYLDGSRQQIVFAYDEVKPELLKLCQSDDLVCSMQVWWEDDPSVQAPISRFKGTATMLDNRDYALIDNHSLTYHYREMDVTVFRGFVCEYEDTFYYVDYQENLIADPSLFIPYDNGDFLKAYEITDPELIEKIDKSFSSEYGGETELGQLLSAIFLCFVFAVIPLGIMVGSIIFAVYSKGYYRLTWAVTAGLCAAELGVFAIIVSLILRA